MTDKDKKQLEYELRHIFESGANELRVYEMVVNFIESRELVNKTNDIHDVIHGFYDWHKKQGYVSLKRDDLQEYVDSFKTDV